MQFLQPGIIARRLGLIKYLDELFTFNYKKQPCYQDRRIAYAIQADLENLQGALSARHYRNGRQYNQVQAI